MGWENCVTLFFFKSKSHSINAKYTKAEGMPWERFTAKVSITLSFVHQNNVVIHKNHEHLLVPILETGSITNIR